MYPINRYTNSFFYGNYGNIPQNGYSDINYMESQTADKEVYATWKYDEEGNIVYYKYDKKTGKLISKTVCKNPAKEINKFMT